MLPTEYQSFIALSRYARWLPQEKRRETWEETVARYLSFWDDRFDIDETTLDELYDAIITLNVMPSMRALMTAGPALEIDNVAGFNCSYREASGNDKTIEVLTEEMKKEGFNTPIKIHTSNPICFDEIMYILTCGTGVGFSAERQVINSLPVVGHSLPRSYYERTEANYPGVAIHELSTIENNVITVADSKYGWASSLRILINELYNGNFDVTWDLSLIRPEGAPLKTFGGRASGPAPLNNLFTYCKKIFKEADGRKLTSIEVHGIVCKIAEIVVVGGVRRSALISLSNLSDDRMRHAKSGSWWREHPEFALANNSVCYDERPEMEVFMREWLALIESKSGERGIFNREASQNQAVKVGRRDPAHEFGTNPCSEIILRDKQFCNLSEIIVRYDDTLETLKEKVRLATILGTLQSTLTDFKYLSSKWKENTEEEALLGVSLTGIMDHIVLSGEVSRVEGNTEGLIEWLTEMKDVAIETNKEWAAKLGVNQSTSITCVKPSGTVSQLTDSASGIHPRYSHYYIRTVRADKKDPLAKLMVDQGFPVEDDVTKPDSTHVFAFPMKAPDYAVFRNDRSALEQLEHWLLFQRHWCEHKPSVTIYVKDDEWLAIGAWVWKYFDEVSGVSFLPHSDHTYQQAPYQEIDESAYNILLSKMPTANWEELWKYETEDATSGARTMACSAGVCEVVDLTK